MRGDVFPRDWARFGGKATVQVAPSGSSSKSTDEGFLDIKVDFREARWMGRDFEEFGGGGGDVVRGRGCGQAQKVLREGTALLRVGVDRSLYRGTSLQRALGGSGGGPSVHALTRASTADLNVQLVSIGYQLRFTFPRDSHCVVFKAFRRAKSVRVTTRSGFFVSTHSHYGSNSTSDWRNVPNYWS